MKPPFSAGAPRGADRKPRWDVYDTEPLPADSPYRGLKNTVLTPHLGFTTVEGLHAFYQPAMENILAFLDGKPVNLMNPEVLKTG